MLDDQPTREKKIFHIQFDNLLTEFNLLVSLCERGYVWTSIEKVNRNKGTSTIRINRIPRSYPIDKSTK